MSQINKLLLVFYFWNTNFLHRGNFFLRPYIYIYKEIFNETIIRMSEKIRASFCYFNNNNFEILKY